MGSSADVSWVERARGTREDLYEEKARGVCLQAFEAAGRFVRTSRGLLTWASPRYDGRKPGAGDNR